MNDVNFPTRVEVVVQSEVQLAAVYAVLGAAAFSQMVPNALVQSGNGPSTQTVVDIAEPTSTSSTADAAASASPSDDGTLDAGGWPWSADMHASTKGTTKEGFWRMKVGVARPADKPGFPIPDAGSTSTGSAGPEASSQSEDAPSEAAGSGEDDEFAAFRAAAEASDKVEAAAAASVPERKWTDADLGSLCNQAAVKLGDPTPIKDLIAEYVTEGETAHSRNIPEDSRAAFAAAVEAKTGITFA